MRTLLPLLLGVGCTGEPDVQTTTDGNITTTRTTTTTNSSGLAIVDVEIPDSSTVMMVTASSDAELAVEQVLDPSGAAVLSWSDWYDAYSLTSAIYVEGNDTVLNWPVRIEDGPLSAGTWQVEIAAVAASGNSYSYISDAELDVTIQTRADDTFSEGTVSVELIFADGVGEDSAVVSATEEAVARWRDIWQDYGLSLELTYYDSTIDADLTDLSSSGSVGIAELSASGADVDMMVLIGETIGGDVSVYGISGGIPGPLVESPRAAVVISWLANAGSDGTFSEDDIRLYGETLAHEVGHYMGLFHPVEDGWQYWDALDDTAECDSASSCESSLGDNLMFPYPVCKSWTSCTHQDQLSGGQQGVSHRYVGTD